MRCPECGRAFRHQVVNGTAQWICTCRSSGATDCQHRHVREEAVYEIFTDMVIKLKTYRNELLGTLIHQMELMQDRTSRNQERIRQVDKEIADLGAKNHIIARLHTSGALTAVEYAMQTSEIGNRLTELRIERRQKLTEDEDDQAALSVGTKGGSSTSLITHGILAQRYIRRLSSKRLMRKYKRQSTVATPKRIRIRHKRYSG